uniref:Tudor domain-containing protein n=1 Tax=Parastrongyloides trichosuri TaxID=131310 RepID=A0A0N4ZAG4_PARTI
MHQRQYHNKKFRANTIRSNYSRTSKYSSYYEKPPSTNIEEELEDYAIDDEKPKYIVKVLLPKSRENVKFIFDKDVRKIILDKITNSTEFVPKEIEFDSIIKPLTLPKSIFTEVMEDEVYAAMQDNYKLATVSRRNESTFSIKTIKKFPCTDNNDDDNYSVDSFYNERKIKKIYSREIDMINHMLPDTVKRVNKYTYNNKKEQNNYKNDFDRDSSYYGNNGCDSREKSIGWNDDFDTLSKFDQLTIKDSCFSLNEIFPIYSTLTKTKYYNVMERDNSPLRRVLSSSIYLPRKMINSDSLNIEIVNIISPSFIYVRELNHIADELTVRTPIELKILKEELEDIIHYNADELFEIQNCKEPFLWRYCMAPYDEKSLARARIIQKINVNNTGISSSSTDDTYVKVFFLDYGTTTWTWIKCCYQFPYPEWYSYPPQVIPITIGDIAPKSMINSSADGRYRWPASVCMELKRIVNEYDNFEISIINKYAQKKDKMFTYNVYLFGRNKLTDGKSEGGNMNKISISSILVSKCFNELVFRDEEEVFGTLEKYDVENQYIIDFNSLPDYLKSEHKLIKMARLTKSSKVQENFSEEGYKSKRKVRIPPLLVPVDVWPRGNLPWDYDTLVYSGFVSNNVIGFIPNDQSLEINCFSFSALPLLNYQIEQSFTESNIMSEQIVKILNAKKLVDDALNNFYRVKDNRRCFNWDYVQGKLESYEPVNCVVGLIEDGETYNFNCRRARIHYLVENFAEEFDLFAKGVVPTHRKKHIRYVIAELYDYADMVIVPTDAICQIHPMHDIINPFSLRMCMDYDIGLSQSTKFESLLKSNSQKVVSLKKQLSEIISIPTPKRAILQSGPSVGMKIRYKFEYFVRPWKDPFSYKIRFVTDLWSDKQIYMDKDILTKNEYFRNYRSCVKLDSSHIWSKYSPISTYNNQRIQQLQKKKKLLTKGISNLKSFQSYYTNNT